MRHIPEDIKQIIIDTLPKQITEAIYIFGSFGTEYFDENNSDIDIAWFTSRPIDYTKLNTLEFELCEKLGCEVDLVIPDKNNVYFLGEVLSSPPLVIYSDEFSDWLDRFNDWVLDEYRFIENVIQERCGLFE